MTEQRANDFANRWISAWNTNRFEDVLGFYADDFTWSSSCRSIHEDLQGTLKGKEAVRRYWQKTRSRCDAMHAQLVEVKNTDESITIYYRTGETTFIADVLFLNDAGKVAKAVTLCK